MVSFSKIFYIVGVTKAYDNFIFKSEFYGCFPDIESFLLKRAKEPLSIVYNKLVLIMIGETSFFAIKGFITFIIIMTEWTKFLKKNGGKGYTKEELSKKYCRENLGEKIAKNMREGRYKSREQAIAVAYSQIRKAYPECTRFFKRKDN